MIKWILSQVIQGLIIGFVLAYIDPNKCSTNIVGSMPEECYMDHQSDDILQNEEIIDIKEEQPRYPGCEATLASNREKEQCSGELFVRAIYKHLTYPNLARNHLIQGTCIISFDIEKDGNVSNFEIRRDKGGGTGQAAKDAVEIASRMSGPWIPATFGGLPVKVKYTVPVKFDLKL